MFRNIVIPAQADNTAREEIRKSWKTRGYLVTFEDEVGAEKVATELAVEAIQVEVKQVEVKPEPTAPTAPIIEEVIEEETTHNLPEDLKCPHCLSKARSESSYRRNHGDACFSKED